MEKTAFITGAAGNLGLAMVKKFLAGGYKVVGTKLDHERVASFENHENFDCLDIDLSQEDAVNEAISFCENRGDSIGAAVLTVGGFAMGDLEHTGKAELDRMIGLNFYIAYYSAKAVFKHMKAHGKGGHIFLIGARPALSPASGTPMVAYTLSKSLIPNLAEILNAEGKAHGITTSVIVPSIIDTPQNRAAMPDADFEKWVTPDAIAEVAFFTASDEGNILREPILKVYGDS
ncbi:MAG: SDR family NAD(P)-dependent oxidoreductase [Bacteroidota bacterium]